MSKKNYKNKVIAIITTLTVHAALLVALLFIFLPKVEWEEAGGILVNIGDVDMAAGTFTPEPYEPQPSAFPTPPTPAPEATEELITQESEDAPVVAPPAKKETPRKRETPKPVAQPKQPSREEQQRRAAEEAARRRAQEEQRRRDAISKSVSGAFGNAKGSGSGEGATGKGKEGSPDGNVQSGGANSGVGGFGSFNLAGRSLAGGSGLPRPQYTAQVEGAIVIRITVDPSGKVIATSIAPGTTISDFSMRQSALRAAASAHFNPLEGINNQTGTITYRYRLK